LRHKPENSVWNKIHALGTDEEDLMGYLKNSHNEECYVTNNLEIVTFEQKMYNKLKMEYRLLSIHFLKWCCV
jgi:hypothetical protein